MKKTPVLLLSLLLPLVSCSNLFNSSDSPHNDENKIDQRIPERQDKAYITIGFTDKSPRTLLPSQTIQDLVLTGTLSGGKAEELATAPDRASMTGKEIEIYTGNWSFTMTGKVGSVTFTDTITSEVKNGNDNTLNFTMKPVDSSGKEITTGTLDISVTFEGKATYAKLFCTKSKDNSSVETKDFTNLTSGSKISYKKVMEDNTGLPEGTYTVKIEFYENEPEADINPLSTWKALARVVPGFVTVAEESSFNLNDVYTILYKNIEGSKLKTGAAQIETYSRKNTVELLHEYERDTDLSLGKFLGWYTSADYEPETKITKIEANTKTGNLELYAKWSGSTIFVDTASGSDTDGDSSIQLPFKTLAKAVSEINARTYTDLDYIINITGETADAVNLTSLSAYESLTIQNEEETTIIPSFESSIAQSVILEKGISIENELTVNTEAKVIMNNSTSAGSAAVNGTLEMNDSSSIETDAEITGTMTMKESSKIGGNATVSGALSMQGSSSVTGNTNVTGSVNIEENAVIEGKATLSDETSLVTMKDKALIKGGASVSGIIQMQDEAVIEGTTTLSVLSDRAKNGMIELTGDLTKAFEAGQYAASIATSPDKDYRPDPDSFDQASTRRVLKESSYNEANYKKFDIIEKVTGDTHWEIGATGCLVEKKDLGLNIEIIKTENDIEVTAATSGNTVTFTASEGYSSYKWSFDGTEQSSSSNTFSKDTTDLVKGTYDVLLTCNKTESSETKEYSYHGQIKVPLN